MTELIERQVVEDVLAVYQQKGGAKWLAMLPDELLVRLLGYALQHTYNVTVNDEFELPPNLGRQLVEYMQELTRE